MFNTKRIAALEKEVDALRHSIECVNKLHYITIGRITYLCGDSGGEYRPRIAVKDVVEHMLKTMGLKLEYIADTPSQIKLVTDALHPL